MFVSHSRVLIHGQAGAIHYLAHLFAGQLVQHEHARAREKRGDDLEAGVFRSGAHEREFAALHIRQKEILLGFVEAMDLVQEQKLRPQGVAHLHNFLDILLARGHRGELEKIRTDLVRVNFRQGRLAHARRPPQKEREKMLLFYGHRERLALAYQVLLAYEFFEVFGADTGGERLHMSIVILILKIYLRPWILRIS